MGSKIDRVDRLMLPVCIERLKRIETEQQRQWGALSPAALFAHLAYTFRLSLGEEKDRDMSVPGLRNATYFLLFKCVTRWPGARVKAPPSFTPVPVGDADRERDECLAALKRFVEALERDPTRKTLSPLLGMITLERWSRVHAVHLSHHFRQYGV